MSEGGSDQDNPPSAPSSSERESSDEEPLPVEQPSGEGAAPSLTRSIQVVATAPRPQRDLSDEDEDQDEEESKSSSSADEEDGGDTAAAEGPARGKSYLQSIRARKPKKKVYAKPKGETVNYRT